MTDLSRPPLQLIDVIKTVPDRCRERSTSRGLGLVARDVTFYAVTVISLVLVDRWYLVIPLWLLAGLAVAGMFVLGHDAAHNVLVDDDRLNRTLGRILFVPALHIHESWVLGHNRIHHGHTLKQGMDFVWHPITPQEYAALSPSARFAHRVEWSVFGAGVYYLRRVWWSKMVTLDPPAKWADTIRSDRRFLNAAVGLEAIGLVVIASLGTDGGVWSMVTASIWMLVKVIVVPFLLFTWIIGWTVYVHHIEPGMQWHTRATWTKIAGQLDGTTVLRMPPGVNLVFHWIFVHMPHHVDMRIPCYHLEEAAEAIIDVYPDRVHERRFRWRDYLQATRCCKVYDFNAGTWLPYPG